MAMRQSGVSLAEMIMVIAITGILAAGVAVFIQRPVEGYVDASRRAALTDEADTALRRITRELRMALPNSVRVDGSGQFVEFILTSGGGRYRAEVDSGGGGNILDFTASDSNGFEVLGTYPTLAAGEQIVVYNLYSDGTISNAYAGGNRASLASTATPPVQISSFLFPAESPGHRFHVATGAVTYGCTGGQLIRYSGYGYNNPQVAPPAGGSANVLAGHVGSCQFTYTTGGLSERSGTVMMVLELVSAAAGGGTERVRLFQQAQVNNLP